MNRNVLFAIICAAILISTTVKAQYCGGNSGTGICTPVHMTVEGFEPPDDSLPCIVDGVAYSEVVSVHTPATVTNGGTSYTLDYITIDTVSNLPCGMCWLMGASNFEIAGNATGCLKLSGTTYDAPGEYLLHIIVNVTVPVLGFPYTDDDQNLASQGLKYYVRVQLPGDACIAIDTNATGNTASHAGTLAAPTISGNTAICSGGSTTLTASGTNIYAYAWSNGSFNSSITVSALGTYTVTAYGECTTATASKTVTLATVRDTIAASGSTTICQGSGVTLSVPAGSTAYHWSTGATTNSISVTTAGTYLVTVTNSSGCSAVSSGVTVTVNPSPIPDTITAGGATVFCQGGSVTLSVPSGSTSYLWSSGATTTSITVNTSGTYLVTTTNSYGCSAVSSGVNVTVNPGPSDTIAASGPATFCQGGNITLLVPSGASSYEWSTGGISNSIIVTTSGTYTVTVTTAAGCSAVSSGKTVTVNPDPNDTIYANGSLSFCPGGSVILSGASGLSYVWSNGQTTQSITANQSGNYSLTVTNTYSCSATATPVTVNAASTPDNAVTLGGASTFCAGGSVTLTGAAGLTYNWSTGATTQSIMVTQSGQYFLTVSNGINCSAVSSGTDISVYPAPADTVTASGPLSFCTGGSVALTVDQGLSGLAFNWSTGANSQSVLISQTGTYYVTVTNGNNCTAVSSPIVITASVNPSDTITASGPLTFCTGGSVVLSAASGLNYTWSTGATSQHITVTQSGSYSVTLTNSGNCSVTSTPVVVTVNANPDDTITVSGPTTFCTGGSVTLTAASGLTYHWNNGATTGAITVTQAGSFDVTVTNSNNCSAVSSNTINTVVNSLPDSSVTVGGPATFCQGGSVNLTALTGLTYNWSNGTTGQSVTIIQSGSYTVTVTNANHCSAVSSPVTVTVNSLTAINTPPSEQETCLNGAVTFNVAASGDDITYQWQKNGTDINGQTGTSYAIAQATYADTGKYSVIVSGVCGTDTSGPALLVVSGSLTFSQQPASQAACAGNSVSFTVVANGVNTTFQWLKDGQDITNANSATYIIADVNSNNAGTYTCYATSSCGDATSNAATLTVNSPSSSTISKNICAGSSYNFNGRVLSAAGNYSDTLSNAFGCDSIITLNLSVSPPITYSYSDSICSGSSYNFNGATLVNAGTYVDTLVTLGGCDSIVTLHLSIKLFSTSSNAASICQGQSYNFNGQILTTAGTYRDTLGGSNGCDSIAILHLTVNQSSSSATSATICVNGTYNFYGRILNTAGIYTDTLNNMAGCDSIVTLHLNTITTIYYSYSAAICAGKSYNFNGRSLTIPGVYNDTLQSVGGCDSVVTVQLAVNPASATTLTDSICAGSSYTFAGRALTASGTYYDTLSNVHGCDSVITLNLTVKQPVTTAVHAAICTGGSYTFNGQQLTVSGIYSETLTTHQGCDSVVTLTLQVNSSLTDTISIAICAGSTYNFNGRSVSTSSTYYDTLTAHGGCDSIVILKLTVNQAAAGSVSAAICSGGSYMFGGRNLTTAGTYRDTLTGSNGCDSIVTLTLQINPFVTSSITGVVCQGASYNFNGRNLTQAGTYRDTLTAVGGCDSIVKLTLTVSQPASSTIYVSICVGTTYLFNGTELGETGTYFEALTGSNSCDSVVTLQLTVNSFLTSNTTANICHGGSYNFNGRMLDSAGTYSDTLLARGGCDSIVTLTLTTNPVITHTSQVSVCTGSSYNFNGRMLDTAGTYQDTLTTQGGCDSVSIIQLSITPVLSGTAHATVCVGGSYNFNGRTVSSPGTYIDTITSMEGCDSVVTLYLSLGQGTNIQVYDSICSGSSYFFNGQHLIISGTYADTVVSQGGCDSIVTLYLTVKPSPAITWGQADTICDNDGATQITIAAPSPAGGILSGTGLNGLVLTVSSSGGTYPVAYNYIDSNGCSSTITKDLVVESCLGIEQVTLADAISVYPNPANNVVIAQGSILAGTHSLPVVYDIMGKEMVVPYTQQADKYTFNTGSLASGVYWVKFNINGVAVSKHFVKTEQ